MTFPCYVGPMSHDKASLQVAGEGDSFQVWTVIANILNK
jgi:hypothetical protein